MKPKKNILLPCFECDKGKLIPVKHDYTTLLPDVGEVTLSKVPMEECDCCGDLVTSDEGDDFIEAAINRILKLVSPE